MTALIEFIIYRTIPVTVIFLALAFAGEIQWRRKVNQK